MEVVMAMTPPVAAKLMALEEALAANDLRRQMDGVWFDDRLSERLRDEAPSAYKHIKAVLRAQRDLFGHNCPRERGLHASTDHRSVSVCTRSPVRRGVRDCSSRCR